MVLRRYHCYRRKLFNKSILILRDEYDSLSGPIRSLRDKELFSKEVQLQLNNE